jgi:hypothetical protein
LNVSVFLPRQKVRSPRCQVLGLFADDHDQFAFVVYLWWGVGRDHHRFVVGDQRVVGTVADVGFLREHRFDAALVGHFADVGGVVDPGGVEGARDDRDFQLYLGEFQRAAGGRGVAPGFAVDFGNRFAGERPVSGPAVFAEAYPAHDQ